MIETSAPAVAPGRPRSEEARQAVLEAVDDLLVDIGYAAMTMKNIAERAGVSRPTVYRWWASKADILVEACAEDAATELALPGTRDRAGDLVAFLREIGRFLTAEPPGRAYRALLGEAQHDPAVARLMSRADVLAPPTVALLRRWGAPDDELAVAQLLGPVLLHVMVTSAPPADDAVRRHVATLLRGWA